MNIPWHIGEGFALIQGEKEENGGIFNVFWGKNIILGEKRKGKNIK